MTAELANERGTMLEQAIAYLADAWSVFPVCSPVPSHAGYCEQHGQCKNPGKLPLVKWGVYQDRNPTRLEVQNWWRKWPNANIGLATGVTSDIVVVDLDGELAMQAAERYGYEHGPWVRTGRVGGRHLYFRYRSDAPTIFSKVGGIDFRGQGGFVLLPPSVHHTGNRYSWGEPVERGDPLPDLPHWVDELGSTSDNGTERGPIDFGNLLSEGVQVGQRDQELFRAAAKLRGADVPYQLAVDLIERAAQVCKPPFDIGEARAKVDSAYRRYQPNPPAPMQLFERTNGHSVNTATGEVLDEAPWRRAGDVVRGAPEHGKQIMEGFLWEGRTHWVYSGPGAGKTLLWLAILLHVAAGREFHGHSVMQGPVLIIEEDSPDSIISDYLVMLADIYDFDLDTIDLWFNRTRGIRLIDQSGFEYVRNLISQAPSKPIVVALDACERIVPSESFNSRELDPLSRLFTANLIDGITNVMIDHTRKPNGSVEKPDPLDTLYGGRTKSAISDVMMHLSGGIKTQAVITFPKFRGEEPAPITVSFDGASGFTFKSGKQKLSESERLVMREISNSFGIPISKSEIAERSKQGEKTVQRALAHLEEIGWVERSGSTSATRFSMSKIAPGVFG